MKLQKVNAPRDCAYENAWKLQSINAKFKPNNKINTLTSHFTSQVSAENYLFKATLEDSLSFQNERHRDWQKIYFNIYKLLITQLNCYIMILNSIYFHVYPQHKLRHIIHRALLLTLKKIQSNHWHGSFQKQNLTAEWILQWFCVMTALNSLGKKQKKAQDNEEKKKIPEICFSQIRFDRNTKTFHSISQLSLLLLSFQLLRYFFLYLQQWKKPLKWK